MKRNHLVVMAAIGWWLVALGLNAARLRAAGDAALVMLAFALVPNLMIWRRLARYPGGKVLAFAIGSSYVLMNLWNVGLGAYVRATVAGPQPVVPSSAQRNASPAYRAAFARDLAACQETPGICSAQAFAYREREDWDNAITLYRVCCAANETECCDHAAHINDTRPQPGRAPIQ